MRFERTTQPGSRDVDYWSVDLEDGGALGLAWTGGSVIATEEEVERELARQQIVLHHAFAARLRSRQGMELRIERPDEDLG